MKIINVCGLKKGLAAVVCDDQPATLLFSKGKCIMPAHITGSPFQRPLTHNEIMFPAQGFEVEDVKSQFTHLVSTCIVSPVVLQR